MNKVTPSIMKVHSLKIVSLIAIASASALLASTLGNSAQAETTAPTTFACGASSGVPATMAQTQRGEIPVIRWSSDYFSDSGWTPERRCQEVSTRFQTYQQDGSLKYLTTGVMNGMSVVCTTDHDGGTCKNLLFTLKAGSNAGQTLRDLLQVRTHATGPLNQSEARVYINMDEYLQTAPLDGETPVNSPDAAAPGNALW
jgi:Circadian oscillating protein COP23